MSTPLNKRKNSGISLSYMYTSTYFVVNMATLLIYPFCRLFMGLEANASSMLEDSVSHIVVVFYHMILYVFRSWVAKENHKS